MPTYSMRCSLLNDVACLPVVRGKMDNADRIREDVTCTCLQVGRRRVAGEVRKVERRPAAAHVVVEEDVDLLAEVLCHDAWRWGSVAGTALCGWVVTFPYYSTDNACDLVPSMLPQAPVTTISAQPAAARTGSRVVHGQNVAEHRVLDVAQ